MKLAINGQEENLEEVTTIEDVLDHFGITGGRIAIEQNGTIVKRDDWSTSAVTDGDRLEIVHFKGGG
ncbi:sulfur carrier protein ThiS [Salisediminibacterium selenitireducens]|uniref:Thiamine biosynthesis protein ThiS n=1 Tax=Bacillus selenitireducens (strain ATCC 700615 / DSM 15326 / MLS10) TaxID=439292 RepID=D6XYC0_BACIE|nr:sulfur carrier protein ThiS [Salisediminibacterium selenitireducens]ADI00189.1 thiamine biosynthesis protein ThiS [[Bacillus] selenitireducens MLS10]